MGAGIMIVLFIILWILVTVFLPIKDMIEKNLSKASGAFIDVKVKSDESQIDEKEEGMVSEEDVSRFDRYPKSGYCDVCGKMVRPHESFMVPVDTFYDSEEYRDYLKKHPSAKAKIESIGIDTYIAQIRAKDKTEYSTICPDCIYMFE
jgi:hypothetical protein